MTQEEIIRMARKTGLIRQRGNLDIVKHSITQIERFAALVAAHEREACAAMWDNYSCDGYSELVDTDQVAASIRARGKNELPRRD